MYFDTLGHRSYPTGPKNLHRPQYGYRQNGHTPRTAYDLRKGRMLQAISRAGIESGLRFEYGKVEYLDACSDRPGGNRSHVVRRLPVVKVG